MSEASAAKAPETVEKAKGLSFGQLVWLGTGMVIGAGLVTHTGVAIMYSGRSVWLAYIVSVLLGTLTVIPTIFYTSTAVFPGGSYGLITRVLGPQYGGMLSIKNLLQWATKGVVVIAMGQYINSMFPAISTAVAGTIIWTIMMAINLFGMQSMAKLQSATTIALLIGLALFSIVGMTKLNPAALNFSDPEFFANGFSGFSKAVVLLGYACMGHSGIANMATRCKNPKKDIPLALIVITGIMLLAYVGVGLVHGGVLPLQDISGKPLTITANAIFSPFLFILFMIAGPIFALFTTANGGIPSGALAVTAGVKEGWLPKLLAKENKYHVPYISYILIYIVGLIPLLTGVTIGDLTSFVLIITALTSFMFIAATFRLPYVYKEEWEKSRYHVPTPIYMLVAALNAVYQVYILYSSVTSLFSNPTLLIINIVTVAASIIYGVFLMKRGHIKRADDV